MSVDTALLEAQQPMMTMVLFVDWECPASSNIVKTSDLGALEGLDKYGRAFYKKISYYFCVEAAMWTDRTASSWAAVPGSARGLQAPGWCIRTPWPLPSPLGPHGAAFLREF